jgi:PKD repeat protein
MKTKLKLTCFAVLVSVAINAQTKKKVLFIGNSYTFVNNLPQMIKDLALPLGDTLVFDQSVFGGYFFQSHCNNPQTWSKIKSQQWDAVVLQAQSQEPSWDLWQVMQDTYPFAKQLTDSVKAHNACTEVIFYMTWGRQNGDASNCANVPAVCTYTGMQARLRESYMLFKTDFKTAVAPVGVAWKKVRQNLPTINLYDPDQSHPSLEGSYLAACVFYSNIFQKTSVGSSYLATLSATVASQLQTYGSTTVMDSLNLWGVGSNKPKVDFTFTPLGNNSFQFNNLTLYANTYNWSFGSTLQNPTYTFPNAGVNSVTLSATNACTTTTKVKQVLITGITKHTSQLNFSSYFNENTLYLNGLNEGAYNLQITSVDGKSVYNKTLNSNASEQKVLINDLPQGMYIIKLSNAKQSGNNKILIN